MSQETLVNPTLSEETLAYVDGSEVDFPLNAVGTILCLWAQTLTLFQATHIVPEFYGPSFDLVSTF